MSDKEARGRRRHGALIGGRGLLSVAFAGSAALICALLTVVTATVMKERVREQIGCRLRDAVLLGAARVDAGLHDTLVRPEQEGNAAYRSIQATLQDLQRSLEDVHYVYTMRMDPEGRIVFVVDEETNPAEVAHLGDVYSDASPLLQERFSSLEQPLVETQTYTDRWGTWLSGYAPFYTADGRRSGVLGMDIKAHDIAAVQRRVLLTAGMVFASFLPLCAGLGWLLASWLSRPLRELAAEAGSLICWPLPRGTRADVVAELRILRASLRALARVLDGIRDSVVATDMEGTIVYANETATRLLGKPRKEMLGRKVTALGEDAAGGATQAEILQATRDSGAWEGTVVNHCADGREIIFESRTQLLHDDKGTPIGMVGMSTDITEKEEAEARRRALEAQLRQSQKLESIGTLASGMAHEINNPINGIMNYAQLIKDRVEGKDPAIGEFAGEAIHETERVATLVRKLLSFARQEKQLHSAARLCDIVEDTFCLMGAAMRHDEISLDVNVSPDLPQVTCCAQQIQQILVNLLANAREALNERYPGHDDRKSVSITAAIIERDGCQWIRTTVEDRGPGISDNVGQRMFDPFYTTKSRAMSSGLGLSVSHGIASEHGGTLTFESCPGEWTRFHLDLPADSEHPSD